MEKPMRYAYEVYRQKSFSRAANALYISQPALSAIIRKLEDELETQLFDRSTKPVTLTPAGQYYIHCTEQIMAVETSMSQYFDDLLALKKGSIRIGASTYFCSSILPGLLRSFREAYPHIAFTLEENNSTPELKEHLLSKEIDFALTSNTYPEEDYDAYLMGDESIILCVPKDNPVNQGLEEYAYSFEEILQTHHLGFEAADSRRVAIGVFKEQDFITIDRISDLYPRILGMFKTVSVTPHIVMHLQQMSSCYYMAASGFGCAFLRAATLQMVQDTGTLNFYHIDSPGAMRPTRLYYKRSGYMSKAMATFLVWLKNQGIGRET